VTQAAAQSSASTTADVIVVGAGPAGSSAAYHMATLGLDVILLEKQELGRDKVCGDGLTPSAVREELGGYYSLGRAFAALIERPRVMRACVAYGLGRPTLMRLVMKLLSDCYDRRGGDWMDRLEPGAPTLFTAAGRLAGAPDTGTGKTDLAGV